MLGVLEIKLALILRTARGGGGDTRARVCDIGFIIINRETNKDLMEICPAKCDTYTTCMEINTKRFVLLTNPI